MIYFTKEVVQFPRHFNENPTRLILTNEVTNEVTELTVRNMSDNPRSYAFNFTSVTLDNGTYKYNLGSEVGLLQVGDYVSTSTEYNENRNNKVYER